MCLFLSSYLQDAAAKLISEKAKAKMTKPYFHLSPSLSLYYSLSDQIIIFSALLQLRRLNAGLIMKYTLDVKCCAYARLYIQCMWHKFHHQHSMHMHVQPFFLTVCSPYGHLAYAPWCLSSAAAMMYFGGFQYTPIGLPLDY